MYVNCTNLQLGSTHTFWNGSHTSGTTQETELQYGHTGRIRMHKKGQLQTQPDNAIATYMHHIILHEAEVLKRHAAAHSFPENKIDHSYISPPQVVADACDVPISIHLQYLAKP